MELGRIIITGARPHHLNNVAVVNRDGRAFLNEVLRDHLCAAQTVFFYLNAEPGGDSQMAEELDLITGACDRYLIMLDGVAHPFDAEYAFADDPPGHG